MLRNASKLIMTIVFSLMAINVNAQAPSFSMPVVSGGVSNYLNWRLIRTLSPSLSLYRVTFNGNQTCRGTLAFVDDSVVWKIENCTNGGSCIGFGDISRGGSAIGMYHCGYPNSNTFRLDDAFDLSVDDDFDLPLPRRH